MSQYRAYPAYKDSGIEWIGQVPEHWEVKPICRVTSVNDDVLPDSTTDDTPIRYVDISSVGYMEGIKQASDMCFADAPSRARRKASSGDVIISTVRTYLKAVAAVTDEYADCVFSTGFAVLRARHLDSSFLKWMVLNELLIQAIEAHSEGLSYPAINASALVKLKSVIPPPEEQASIAATLDRETARIDALIEKKTRFIELMKEKRQALITHAVTKGLDPNVKMKDSGVEWIGLVPEHWDVKPFFALVTELNRKNVGLVETNILSLSYGNIIQKPETRNMGLTPESYETYQIVESGETVFRFTDLQNDKHSLRSALVTQRGIITSAYMAVKPHSIDSTYFAWLMRSYDLCKVFYAMGGGLRQSLKFEDVRRLPVLIPPVDEQSAITNTINAGTARIDALVEKTEQSITLLKERRAAFITAAVTGQIDLRGKQ
ncbi:MULTISPECIES: restriction endonuclease subunit S [Enterobacteriaceae]|uniref:restriction endonuclease subunit S n=1 Tax=Enterobacteriaceae TaxID=543 RepID=UPI0025C82ABB|nr:MULTISPECIES: restriction endonuclease subunit S [Enterobacteriaceae]EKW8501434.1 restriction endonuclease subunit S [Morganella morganii]MEB2372995.1 restriction endonuclease subunit S [Klebsiella pneumoniae]MEB2378352.1 restriction endonuclease subunit S [Citrobacter freundii]